MKISAKTEKVGLIGFPIHHSKSPEMVNNAFSHMKVDFLYTAFNVEPQELQKAVESLRVLNFKGWNVTIPFKVDIQKYLDKLDESAIDIGAVNTVVNENGVLTGYNTDGQGYLRSIIEETGVDLASQNVLILGAGGAARAIGYILAKHGVRHITIANRTISKANDLAKHLCHYVSTKAISLEGCAAEMKHTSLLINATSVGMHPAILGSPINAHLLHANLIVSDLVYNPKNTALIKAAKKRKAKVHYGLGMLIYQAAIAIELWTGRPAPTTLMREILEGHGLKK